MTNPMLLALLALGTIGAPKEVRVLAVDGLIVGAATGKGWVPVDAGFARRQPRLSFRPFGIGRVEKRDRRLDIEYEASEKDTYVSGGQSEGWPALLHGAVPKVPRPVRRLNPNNADYLRACGRFLAAHGVPNAKPRITALYRTDLDGDGTAEVLIEASSAAFDKIPPPEGFPANAYALVLLRALRNGKVVETPLEFVHPGAGAMEAKRVRAVADLDGDGRMEVVTGGRGYEWWNTSLWDYRSGTAKRLVTESGGH